MSSGPRATAVLNADCRRSFSFSDKTLPWQLVENFIKPQASAVSIHSELTAARLQAGKEVILGEEVLGGEAA